MRRIFSISIIPGLVMLLLFQTVSANTGLEKVQSLIAEGKLQQALTATDEFLDKDPKNIQGRFTKGLILTKLNNFDQAEKIFLEVTQEHPRLPEPYNNLAVIYAAQGEYEKARKVLLEAISTHPSYATAHENIGDIYAKMASQAYNQALQLDKGNQTAREKLSLIGELFSAPISVASQQEPVKPEAESIVKVKAEQVPATNVNETPPPSIAKQEDTQNEIPDSNQIQVDDSLKEDVLNSVNSWSKAWSDKNVKDYLGFYASEFKPPDDLSRSNWENIRADRLSKPKFISVDIITPTVTMHGNDHASVDFLQSYQSDTYKDEVNKTLLMKHYDGRWLIVEEKSR